MEALLIKYALLLSFIASAVQQRFPGKFGDFTDSVTAALGGGDQLDFLSDHMTSVMNTVGGTVENVNRPDFGQGMKDVLGLMDNVSSDMIAGFPGKPPFNMENHMQGAVGALGPMSCLVGDFAPDSEILGLIMGGMGGAMFGEALGEEASTSSYDMRDTFSEIGAIAGVLGSAGGSFMPENGQFDPDKFKEMIPNADVIEQIWNEAGKEGFGPMDQFPMDKLESLMQASSPDDLKGLLGDYGAMASSSYDKLLQGYGQQSRMGSTMRRIIGIHHNVQRQATGLISAAGMFSGGIGDVFRRAKNGSQSNLKEKIRVAISKIRPMLESWKTRRQRQPGTLDRSISDYSKKRLRMLAAELGKSAGHMGGHVKSTFDSQIIAKSLAQPVFKEPRNGAIETINSADIKKEARMLTQSKQGRMNYQKALQNKQVQKKMEDCMGGIMPILEEIERIKMKMEPEMKILDWKPPFHTSVKDSWSKRGLPRFLVGNDWTGEWNFDDQTEFDLPERLIPSDFANSFVPNVLKDPEIVDFINYANTAGKTKLIDFLKGQVQVANLAVGSLREIPVKVLQYIKNKDLISLDNLLDVVKNGRPDVRRFHGVLKNISDARLLELTERASGEFWSGDLLVDPKMASIINKELSRRIPIGGELFEGMKPGTLARLACPFGVLDFFLNNFGDSFKSIIPEIEQCVEVDIQRIFKDKKTMKRLGRALYEAFSGGISFEEAGSLRYLINSIPPVVFNNLQPEEIAAVARNVSAFILPNLPQFKPLVQSLSFQATNSHESVNDTSVLDSLGIVACGLRDSIADRKLQVSAAALDVIKENCREGLKRAKVIVSDMTRECLKNRNCRFSDKKPPIRKVRPHGPLREDFETILGQSAGDIFERFVQIGEDDLTRDEKSEIVKKLMQDKLLDFPESWEAVGVLASEIPADSVMQQAAANLTNFVTRNPRLVQKMPDFIKVAMVSKLSSDIGGLLQEAGRIKSLTARIPNSMLEDLDFSSDEDLDEAVKSTDWLRGQALRLTSSSRSLTLNDIRKMGKLAAGLTCQDVRKMKIGLMLEVAIQLDASIGNNISPDLAECVAFKLYLHLRSTYKNDKGRISEVLAMKVPPVFAAFYPVEFLRFLPRCTAFFKRIAPQLNDFFPSLAGGFILEELAGEAFNCFAYSMSPMNDDFQMNDMFPGPAMSARTNDYSMPSGVDFSDFGDGFFPDMSNMQPGVDFPDFGGEFHPEMAFINHTYNGQPEFYEDDAKYFFSDQMGRIPTQNLHEMGDLICRIRAEAIEYSPSDQLPSILKAMHRCLNRVSRPTLEILHQKIEREFGGLQSWGDYVLRTLGPFVATFSASKLQNIPRDAFVSAFDYLVPPPRRQAHLVGDKTSDVLDVKEIFSLDMGKGSEVMMGSGPPVLDASYSPIKREEFFTAAIANLMQGEPTTALMRRFGPDVLPFLSLDAMPANFFIDALGVFGETDMELASAQENKLKGKVEEYMTGGNISKLPDGIIRRLGKLSPMFTNAEIADKFEITTLETLATLGKARWRNADQVAAVLDIYLNGRGYASLSGPELVAMDNMHCLLDAFKVDSLAAAAFKFALRHIGNLKCFAQDQLDLYKGRVEAVYGSIDGATLQEMGILAAGFSADELQTFGKPGRSGEVSPLDKDVNLISPRALRVMPSARIIAGFDESQLARMGTTNGGVLLQRKDVLDSVSNSTKNAIFASSFGLNAGVYAGFIHHLRNFDEKAMMEMHMQMEDMMKKLQEAMMLGPEKPKKKKAKPSKTKPSQAYGLKDVSQVQRPTPPPLAIGVSKNDISDNFDKKFLKDRVVVEMINNAASNNLKVIEVLKGESSLNDISDEDIGKVPPKILQGLKKDTIQQMSPAKLALILDSDDVSKDPKSLSKVLKKLSMEQFKSALEILSDKMMNSTDGTWRPPMSVQEAVAKVFFKMNHGGMENALRSFLSCMCPFSAGVQPRRILDLPQEESYIKPMIECIDGSYRDLSQSHKKQMLNWVNTMWRKDEIRADKAITLRNFVMDFPLGQLTKSFTISDVTTYVNSGMLSKLDTTHKKFSTFSKFLVKATHKLDITKFNDETFLKNLGRAKCEIRFKHVKKQLDTASLKSLLDYTMKNCKDHATEVKESLEECKGDAALRLKRCELLSKEMKKAQKKAKPSKALKKIPEKAQLKRASIREYEMMKDVVDVYLKDKDLTQLEASDVREVAGAIGAMKPKDIDKLPKQAILDNIDVLKNNTKLTKKQKRKIFDKIQSAGFDMSGSSSVKELGELVTSVPPREFRKLSVTGLRDSLTELKKHSDSLSPAQKKAIMEKLNEGSVSDIVNADLGDLITEIPLRDLDTLETIEMDKLKDKPWSRGQAASIVKKFRRNSGMAGASLSVAEIREMGHASVGVSCMDIMQIMDDETYDATQALVEETEGSLTLDMDDCLSNKLHYSLQVLNGVDYISNATDPDLSVTLEFIAEDVAMMLSPDDLETIPSTACLGIMENIGNAQLDLLPSTTGDLKRERLANISLECIKDNTLVEGDVDESQAVILGQLICDLNTIQWGELSTDAFVAVLPVLRDCFYGLDTTQLKYVKTFVYTAYGSDSSQWDEQALTTLGPLVTILDKNAIDDIEPDIFYESIDNLMPPELSPDTDAYSQVHYDAFYNKSITVVMAQRIEESSRRKREISAPTYEEIVILGPGNVAWSVDELNAIEEEDFTNSLETLGAVNKWSYDQRSALVERLKSIYGSPSTWDSKVLADAQYLIKGLSFTDLSQLQIADIETCTTLSKVEFTNEERTQIVDAYLRANGLDLRLITDSELAGFGSLSCGLDPSSVIQIPVDTVKGAIKYLGELDCFTQTQSDIIKQISLIGQATSIPSSAELYEMGTLAAGLSSGDLQSLPVEAISFIRPEAFLLITPSRIKAGMNETQLLAAGAQNVAALMTPRIFDELLAEQRNALRLAAYGADAVLEDIPITETPYTEPYDGSGEFAVFGDDSEDEVIIQGTQTPGNTTADGAFTVAPKCITVLLVLVISLGGIL